MPRKQKSTPAQSASAKKPTTPMKEKKDVPKKDVPKKDAPKKDVPKKDVAPVKKPVEVATKDVDTEVVQAVPQLTQDFGEFLQKLQQVTQMMTTLRTEFRTLEKKANRELKAAEKASAKRKRKQGNRAPSGFVKPTKISVELASFLSKPEGSEMARTEVTREINAYIRAHKLQDKANGRKINADKKLASLLKLKSNDELTYFNLQKYMSPHFAKAAAPVSA